LAAIYLIFITIFKMRTRPSKEENHLITALTIFINISLENYGVHKVRIIGLFVPQAFDSSNYHDNNTHYTLVEPLTFLILAYY